jgi:hypothetical protein
MKGQVLIIVLIASSLLLVSSLSLSQDYYPEATDSIYENSFENSADMQGYSYDEQFCQAYDGSCSNTKRKYHERPSYTGDTDWLPKSSICLIYSDNYRWIVHDYRIDRRPLRVGTSSCKPIELIRGYYADYYHILGTSLVMSTPNPEIITMTVIPPLPCRKGNCSPS